MNRLLLTLCAGALVTPLAAQSPVTVIRGATVIPVVGARIDGGDVVIRDDRIEAVGRNLAVPPGARVVDATGLFLYPGLIDSGSQLGLQEIGSVQGGTDTRELGNFNPHNLTLTAVNPHSESIPVTRVNGITSAITAASGGLISGSAALIDLAGWTPAEMAVVPRAAMVINYPRVGGGRFGGGGRRGGQQDAGAVNRQVEQLTEYLTRAGDYADRKDRVTAAGGALDRVDLEMEAMIPVVRGELPVVFTASQAAQIRGALQIADRFSLRAIIAGGNEAWTLADTLAARKIPVLLDPLTSSPGDDDPYDMIYANPGVLARAGVPIAFTSGSVAEARNLPYNAALAIAYGLDADEALRAVTITPARIWGAGDRLGSIEPGKVANLQLTTGDPLDARTVIRQVWIRGEAISMTDRHTRLYEQFRARPKPE